MIEVEEIMDESETCATRTKMSDKLKEYIIKTIIPQFDIQFDKCKNKERGIYFMFCNTTKQPGVFSFAICNIGSLYGNIKSIKSLTDGQQMFLLLNDENLGELNDSPSLRKEFTEFLCKYIMCDTLFVPSPNLFSGRPATCTELDEEYGPYISGYIRKKYDNEYN